MNIVYNDNFEFLYFARETKEIFSAIEGYPNGNGQSSLAFDHGIPEGDRATDVALVSIY